MNSEDMTDIKRRLFDAFREDHALLGRALHLLGERIRDRDTAMARDFANTLDLEAGAHVAFEENDFYPALAPFLSAEETDSMYAEHADGRALLEEVIRLGDSALDDATVRSALLNRVYALETHVSECGELFGAMGGLDNAEQSALLARLHHWRATAPRWSEIVSPKSPTAHD